MPLKVTNHMDPWFVLLLSFKDLSLHVCPVAAAEKKTLSGAGQKISLGWNMMGRKCDANFAAAGQQRVTPHLCL